MTVREVRLEGGDTVVLPYPRHIQRRVGDLEVYALKVWKDRTDDPDFDIPCPEANVAAFNLDATLQWTVEPISPSSSDETVYYNELYNLGGRLVSKANTGQFFEIALDSGSIADHWESDQFKIDEMLLEFSGEVTGVQSHEQYIFLITTEHLYVITDDADPVWRRPVQREWFTYSHYEPFTVRAHPSGAGPTYDVTLDPQTGEVIDTKGRGVPDDFANVEYL